MPGVLQHSPAKEWELGYSHQQGEGKRDTGRDT